jgi:hypothetical protein
METRQEIEAVLTSKLAQRGLRRAHGQLAFVHRGEAVTLEINESVYRGHFITVQDRVGGAQEFRAYAGTYHWDSIARAVVEVANRRLVPNRVAKMPADVDADNRRLANELATMTGVGGSSQLSIEPSSATPGRVRVSLQGLELDPASVLRLFAAVSHALPHAAR